MWQEIEREDQKKYKWTSNCPNQTLRYAHGGNVSVKLCLNEFKAEVHAQYAEHSLLLHF